MILTNIGKRLRILREQKNLSQGDLEKCTGILRHCISRVENDHVVPTIETLEKVSRALGVPLYQIFYDGEDAAEFPEVPKLQTKEDFLWGGSGKDANTLASFRVFLSRLQESDRQMLLWIARKMRTAKLDRRCENRPVRKSVDHIRERGQQKAHL